MCEHQLIRIAKTISLLKSEFNFELLCALHEAFDLGRNIEREKFFQLLDFDATKSMCKLVGKKIDARDPLTTKV